MKYIKSFQIISESMVVRLTDRKKQKIVDVCDKYNVKNYTINDDGSIDVNGNVDLSYNRFHTLPLSFNIVTGNFDCSYGSLKTLKGSPKKVGGHFSCRENKLTSLEHCPVKISDENNKGYFNFRGNRLTSLEFFPETFGDINISNNLLTSLEGIRVDTISSFFADENKLTSLKHCPKYITNTFSCYSNELTSLEFGPISAGHYNISKNRFLKSLKYSPKTIRGEFDASNCSISSFEYCPLSKKYKLFKNKISTFDFIPTNIVSATRKRATNIEFYHNKVCFFLNFISLDDIELFNEYGIIADDGETISVEKLGLLIFRIRNMKFFYDNTFDEEKFENTLEYLSVDSGYKLDYS